MSSFNRDEQGTIGLTKQLYKKEVEITFDKKGTKLKVIFINASQDGVLAHTLKEDKVIFIPWENILYLNEVGAVKRQKRKVES